MDLSPCALRPAPLASNSYPLEKPGTRPKGGTESPERGEEKGDGRSLILKLNCRMHTLLNVINALICNILMGIACFFNGVLL